MLQTRQSHDCLPSSNSPSRDRQSHKPPVTRRLLILASHSLIQLLSITNTKPHTSAAPFPHRPPSSCHHRAPILASTPQPRRQLSARSPLHLQHRSLAPKTTANVPRPRTAPSWQRPKFSLSLPAAGMPCSSRPTAFISRIKAPLSACRLHTRRTGHTGRGVTLHQPRATRPTGPRVRLAMIGSR
jgi:hypothetical protein